MSWRLYYKDSNGTNQVLAALQDPNQPSSAYSIGQARYKPRNRGKDKLSMMAESDLFKNVPRDPSNFGTTEPGLYWTGNRFTTAVTGVDTSNDTFTVSGDRTGDLREGGYIEVKGSTGNDGIYKVATRNDATYNSTNDETTISVVEDVTDSTADGNITCWENIFRGKAKNQGKITEQGNVKLELKGFLDHIGSEDVNITGVTGNINDVISQLTPSGYTLDTPSSSNVTYIDESGTEVSGFAPVDSWSLVNEARGIGFREMTRKYGYSINLSADKFLRFEPIGFGSSIDTIDSPAEGDTSNTLGKWKEWTADDTEVAQLVNVVRVVNSKNGTKYDSGIITNSTSVNKYGKQKPKEGIVQNVGYVDSDKEARRVAYNFLRNSQNPTEGGRVKIPKRYEENVANSTFTLNDSSRNISSETFVAWSQVNFYPENKTILEFQFENESEHESGVNDDVRATRSRTFPNQSTDVGNQNVDAETEDVSDQYDAHNAAQGDHDVAGQSYTESIDDTVSNEGRTTQSNVSVGTTINLGITTSFLSGNTDKSWLYFQATVTNSSSSSNGWDLTIQNVDTSTTYFSQSNWIAGDALPLNGNVNASTIVIAQEDLEGDEIEFKLTNNTDSTEDLQMNAAIAQLSKLTINQPSDADAAQPRADGSTNSINTSDSTAGDTTSLSASGSTDAKNVNVATEDKTER